MQPEITADHAVQRPSPVEARPVPVSQWTTSTYELSTSRNGELQVHIDHPNNMGTNESNGLPAEKARFERFRSFYISRELHNAATGQTSGMASSMFRRYVPSAFLEKSRQKTCYHQEEDNLPFFSPSPQQTPVHTDNGVEHAAQNAKSALDLAANTYGPRVIADIQLGFSVPFPLDKLRDPKIPLPTVADSVVDDPATFPSEQILSLVVSYRHATPKQGYIMNIENTTWPSIANMAAKLADAAGYIAVRFWTDQILSSRKPSATLRWVSSGVLPYAIYPVLYVHSDASELHRNLRRMWISVEHLMAAFGQGIVHCGEALEEDQLPLEWPAEFMDSISGMTWMLGLGRPLHLCVRKLCSAIMCGLTRNKEMSWPNDAQDLLDWASSITSAPLFKDIYHSFDCHDCRAPFGYTSGQRFMALLSSAIDIQPTQPEDVLNSTHPRLDVPAVSFEYDGRTWDGFREWIPESCLWGLKEDELRDTVAQLTQQTRVLVTYYGGPRAVAVLQFYWPIEQESKLLTAHLLVGLTQMSRNARRAKVEWSKRFWPVVPLRMWDTFNDVWEDLDNREAFVELGEIVGASSGLDYTDIIGATHLKRLTGRQIRWR